MAALLWLRVLLPLAVLCGCLSEEVLEDPQGDDVTNLVIKESQTGQQKKSLPCYEDDLRFTPVIERDAWDEKKNMIYTLRPVDYVVVLDGGKRCKSHPECLVSLTSETQKTTNSECKTRESFYIGGNGEVYEGRGWLVAPYWHLNGMRRHAVTVKFLGSYGSEGPTERAMRAFWRLVKTGVWDVKLTPDYHIVSMGQVYNDSTLVGDALEKVFQESSVGIKEFSQADTWEITPDKSLPLIAREEWGAKKPKKAMEEMGYRIKYVMMNEGGERCLTHQDCMARIKAEQEEQLPLYGDLADNFYIGDDGYVYEGRGFNAKPLWDIEIEMENSKYFKEETLAVRFFGNFETDHPSEKAIGAFKLLMNAGASLGKLPEGYRIYSLRGIYNDSRFLGDGFLQIARKWTPWATEMDVRLEKELAQGDDFIGMVKRSDWEAKEPTKESEKIKHPVDYVIINEHSESDRCLHSKECMSLMKKIQEKELEGYGDVGENFYISDNGNVYEGRGWDVEPQFQPKYFNKSLITVNFLGNHQVGGASLTALAAFNNLIRVGVNLGKIAPNYQFYSSRYIYDEVGLLGDELGKHFVHTEKWSKKLDTMSENERLERGLLPIVPHSEWSDVSINEMHHPYTHPVKFVVIGNAGQGCSTHEECKTYMKEVQSTTRYSGKGLPDNFYIGNDGMAYEGRGWKFAPSIYFEGLKSEFYYVEFIGKYSSDSPLPKFSILAFNRLMENGVKSQKLSPDFKIISVHQMFETPASSEDHLYKTIKTWDRWTSDFSLMHGEDKASGHGYLIPRAAWHARKPANEIPIPEHPLSYVVVHNVGDHCTDVNSCNKSVQGIQENTPPRYWDVPDNFYVGDDGHVYEGRGWDHSSLWGTRGIENKFISVGFLGSFEDAPPSPKALYAFYVLQQTGVVMGKLSQAFQTISLGEILKGSAVVAEKLIDALNVTESWSDEFELKHDAARLRSINSPLVLSDEWNLSKKSIRMSSKMTTPLKYIAIRDGGASCDSNATCALRIRKEHDARHASSDGGVAENFYVGNDGNVYEGIGWDWDMTWGFSGWQKTVSVQFFGNYENNLPSEKAIEAFNAVIIRDGVETGKLSPDYKIAPIPEGDGRTLGKKLREEILTWKNATEEIE